MFGFKCSALGKQITSDYCVRMRTLGKMRLIKPCSTCEDWKKYFSAALESETLDVPSEEPQKVIKTLSDSHFKRGRKCSNCNSRIADWNKDDLCTKCKKASGAYHKTKNRTCISCETVITDKNVTGYCKKCLAKIKISEINKYKNARTILAEDAQKNVRIQNLESVLRSIVKQIQEVLEGAL